MNAAESELWRDSSLKFDEFLDDEACDCIGNHVECFFYRMYLLLPDGDTFVSFEETDWSTLDCESAFQIYNYADVALIDVWNVEKSSRKYQPNQW
jgi:hypothetical protein